MSAAPVAERDLATLRELAMTSPAGLGYAATFGDPRPYRAATYHARLAGDIVDLIEGRLDLLATSLGVQHGKSELASVLASAFFLGLHPDQHVIACSYSSDFAGDRIGRRVRDLLERYGPEFYGVSIDASSSARNRWNTTLNGGMLAVGVDAGISGRPANLIVIDDVYAGVEEANSPAHRARVKDWYTHEVASRMANGCGTILCNSRWHEDDFFSWLVQHAREIGMRVRVREYPALAVCSVCQDFGIDGVDFCKHGVRDELGRLAGEPLWPEGGRDRAFLLRQRQLVGSRGFSALYQGSPYPAAGTLFRREHFKYAALDATSGKTVVRPQGAPAVLLDQCRRFQVADLAISQSATADFFVLLTGLITPSLDLVIADIVRNKITFQQQIDCIKAAFALWKPIGVGIEAVGYQQSLVQAVRATGIPVVELHPQGPKAARAEVIAAHYESGKVYHLAGAPWLDTFENELLSFGASAHDDQVDVAAYAGLALTELIAKAMSGGPAARYMLPGQGIRIG